MKTDVMIAQECKMQPIGDVAAKLGLSADEIDLYGRYKAKIRMDALKEREGNKDGKLILVTAINPTPAGEGKTTVNIGLSMGLNRIGKKAVSALREPSLGPSFGIKGGAAGGGYAQVVPMDEINMHFTGDFHALTAANNLIAAMIDNHLQQGNELGIDPRRIVHHRVLDMNDRALRNITVGLGGHTNGVPREDHFDITVASELMAIFCLARDLMDLKARVAKVIVAYTYDRAPVTVADLKAQGAVALLMKEAVAPNLVQTLEGTPAIIHGGPFANIAHGCNSVTATRAGLKLADYVVTEAGFGADLGAEKFLDIKCPLAGLAPDAIVIVATVRALKSHGGVKKEALGEENLTALEDGYKNLKQHIENIKKYGVPAVVALNRFPTDTEKELALLRTLVEREGVKAIDTEVFAKGGEGAIELAKEVVRLADAPSDFHPIYDADFSIEEKIETVAREIYRADGVTYSKSARTSLRNFHKAGYDHMPVCIAKTQYSFSDDPKLLGAPRGFTVEVRELRVNAGAGFIVALTGDIMTMPGLPKDPAACHIDVREDGTVEGLF